MTKPVVLIILDGLGRPPKAVKSAWQITQHPNLSELEKNYPFATLQASGLAVGLPFGEPGNSEVGHLTMGAGKIIYNHLPRIITAIQDGSFFENKAFLSARDHVKKTGGSLHFMGLFSSGSVHAYAEHLYALLDFAKKQNIPKVYLHLFTDGRDAAPTEAANFLKKLEENLKKYPDVQIGSLIGRDYAMDREEKWQNIEKTYKLLAEGQGETFENASQYLEKNYKNEITDEFIKPAFAKALADKPATESRIKDGDAVIFFNYREDSARELTTAFTEENFDKFPRKKINDLIFVTMTEYSSNFKNVLVAFPPLAIPNPLAKIISDAELKQLHIGETEKYAHITYFFNGGKEEPFKKEDRILVPSPVAENYDEIPEMSAKEITEKTLEILDKDYDFILINFANADMVGHTGNLKACVKAIEILDECIGKITTKVLEKNGIALITADHGNIEEKTYQHTGRKKTNHTTNPVPFYLVGKDFKLKEPLAETETEKHYQNAEGTLTDIGPTILELLNLKQPPEMTGKSLLPKLK